MQKAHRQNERLKADMSDARAHLGEMVKLARQGAIVRLDRHAKPVAILISWKRFQEMEEDIEDWKLVLRMHREETKRGITGGTLEDVLAISGQSADLPATSAS